MKYLFLLLLAAGGDTFNNEVLKQIQQLGNPKVEFLLDDKSYAVHVNNQMIDADFLERLDRFEIEVGLITFTKCRFRPEKTPSFRKNMKNVKTFILLNCNIDETTLISIVGNLGGLEDLGIQGRVVPESTLKAISKVQPRLKWLSISNPSIAIDALKSLEYFAHLEALNISGADLSKIDLKEIPKLATLDQINLFNTRLTDNQILAFIRSSPNIKEINVGGTFISKTGLEEISKTCRKIEYLCLAENRTLGDELAQTIREMKSLTLLIVRGTSISYSLSLDLALERPTLRVVKD